MSKNLALFDLDHTLLNCDSDVEWSRYLFDRGLVSEDAELQRTKFSDDYHQGILDLEEFLVFQLAPLAWFDYAKLMNMHQDFFNQYIVQNISASAYALVEHHLAAKDDLVLVSATNEFIITPIAHHFNIPNVIGVSLEKDEKGNYTGKYQGIPSYREGKVLRVAQWLASQQLTWEDYQQTFFYSDSYNDLALLQKVTNPVAVNPDVRLKQYATSANWPILYFS